MTSTSATVHAVPPSSPSPIAVRRVVDIVAAAWRLEVLLACAERPRRFGELADSVELQGISPKMLATALRELALHGVLRQSGGPVTRYEATEEGHALVVRLRQLAEPIAEALRLAS